MKNIDAIDEEKLALYLDYLNKQIKELKREKIIKETTLEELDK